MNYLIDLVIDWNEGGYPQVSAPEDIVLQYLHAQVTTMLYHAEGTTGESTPVSVDYTLVDEDGDQLVDESGNTLIVPASESAILFHAKETNTLYHAEA